MVVNMTPKGVFWLSSSVACLGVGSFAVYFMLVYIPNRDSLLAQVAAESARAVRIAQLEDECANRAKSAAQQFVSEQRLVDRSTGFMGFSNHYNRQLQKCVVEIDTASSGSYAATSSRTFVDAHENAILMTCRTVLPHDPKLETKFECQDADLVKIPPEQEDKKLKAIMSE